MKTFSIWVEGYKITGNKSQAQLLDRIEAKSFNEAVKLYSIKHPDEVDFNRFGKNKHAIWGCQLFDNEAKARKSFG
jgi:hypothetical protein